MNKHGWEVMAEAFICAICKLLKKRAFSTEQRLPSNRVSALLIDHSKMLWITTDHGLACLPPQPSMQIYNQNFEHVMSRFYNRSAAILLADGRVALGSTTGVLIFKPHISLTSYQAPSLQLTNFRIDNIDSRESTDMRPELMQMLADSTITLSYRHNSFTIGFESVSFRIRKTLHTNTCLKGLTVTGTSWKTMSNCATRMYHQANTNFAYGHTASTAGFIFKANPDNKHHHLPAMVEHLVGSAIIYHNPMRYYRSDYQKQTATVGAPLYERKDCLLRKHSPRHPYPTYACQSSFGRIASGFHTSCRRHPVYRAGTFQSQQATGHIITAT